MSWMEAAGKVLSGFAAIVIAVACLFVGMDAIATEHIYDYLFVNISKREWSQYFSDIPLPDGSELLASEFESGQIILESKDDFGKLDYGYYWIIKSDLTEEELLEYYGGYAEESNRKFGGYETVVKAEPFVHLCNDYYFETFQTFYDQIEKREAETDHIWVVFALKRGRGCFKNERNKVRRKLRC